MSEREHDDGRCCENGYFGQQHDCRKQPGTDAGPREFWIQKGTPDLIADSWQEAESCQVEHREDLPWVHVIEKSAYDALSARVRELEAEKLGHMPLIVGQIEQIEALEKQVAELKAQLHGTPSDGSISERQRADQNYAAFKVALDQRDQLQSRLAESEGKLEVERLNTTNEAAKAQAAQEKLAAAEAEIRQLTGGQEDES